MKKLISLSLLIILVCSTFVGCDWKSIFPKDKKDDYPQIKYSEGLEFVLNNDGTSYSVAGIGSCTDKEIIIPRTYNDLPVTLIKYGAFIYQAEIKGVVIPDSVTSIGSRAFECCSSLEYVVIPNSVSKIGARAFSYCELLEYIIIPNSVTEIEECTFSHCTSLASVVIGISVEVIDFCAFDSCYSLKKITIPRSTTRIYWNAFDVCTSLKKIIFEDPSNWGYGEIQYDAVYDMYKWVVIPIEEDLSNPEIAAQLLTSTYVDDMLQKIE